MRKLLTTLFLIIALAISCSSCAVIPVADAPYPVSVAVYETPHVVRVHPVYHYHPRPTYYHHSTPNYHHHAAPQRAPQRHHSTPQHSHRGGRR